MALHQTSNYTALADMFFSRQAFPPSPPAYYPRATAAFRAPPVNRDPSPSSGDEVVSSSPDSSRGSSPPELQLEEQCAPDVAGEDEPVPETYQSDEPVTDSNEMILYSTRPSAYCLEEAARCVRLACLLFVVDPSVNPRSFEGVRLLLKVLPKKHRRFFRRLARDAISLEEVCERIGTYLKDLWTLYRQSTRMRRRAAVVGFEPTFVVELPTKDMANGDRNDADGRREAKGSSVVLQERVEEESGSEASSSAPLLTGEIDQEKSGKVVCANAIESVVQGMKCFEDEFTKMIAEDKEKEKEKVSVSSRIQGECSCRYSVFAVCDCQPEPCKKYDLFRSSKDYLKDLLDAKVKLTRQTRSRATFNPRSNYATAAPIFDERPPLPVREPNHEGGGTNGYKKYNMFDTPDFANCFWSSSASARLPAQNVSNTTSQQATYSLFGFEFLPLVVEANPRSNNNVPRPSRGADDDNNNNSVNESRASSEVVVQKQVLRRVAGARGPSGPVAEPPVPLPSPPGHLTVSSANTNGGCSAFEPYDETLFQASIDQILSQKPDSAAAAASSEGESESASVNDECTTFTPIDPSNTVPVDAAPALERSASGAYYDELGTKFLEYRSSTDSQLSIGAAEFVPKFMEVGTNAESQTIDTGIMPTGHESIMMPEDRAVPISPVLAMAESATVAENGYAGAAVGNQSGGQPDEPN